MVSRRRKVSTRMIGDAKIATIVGYGNVLTQEVKPSPGASLCISDRTETVADGGNTFGTEARRDVENFEYTQKLMLEIRGRNIKGC